MPLLAGRDFNFRDVERPPVAIVNQTMARRYFPGVDPIGKQVAIDPDPKNGTWFGTDQPYEIVGLVGDVKTFEPSEEGLPSARHVNASKHSGVMETANPNDSRRSSQPRQWLEKLAS